MKKLFLVSLVLMLALVGVQAQTIGSSTNIGGTNYFPIAISPGVFQTNTPYQTAAYKTITLGGISYTNETVAGYYCVQLTNGMSLAPGTSNYYVIGAFTNNFAAGTNGGSWSYSFNGAGFTMQCPVFLGIVISGGNYTNSVYVP